MAAPNALLDKPLSQTDATTRTLVCPVEFADEGIKVVGRPEGIDLNLRPGHNVEFRAHDPDEGKIWILKSKSRQKGTYLKPYIRGEWGEFARAKNLRAGDYIRFYRNHNPAIQAHVIISIIRAP